jgi:hypothetical protein
MTSAEMKTEWQGWSDRLWESLANHFEKGFALMHLEQKTQRSSK